MKKLNTQFGHAIRSRGEQYYLAGRVRIRKGTETRIIASVSGSRQYAVEISLKKNILCASCSCPYAENDLCKHIWATLLAADRNEFLSGLENSGRVKVLLGSEDEEDWDEESVFGDQDGREDFPRFDAGNRAPRPQGSASANKKSVPKTSQWKRMFDQIQAATRAYQNHFDSAEWPKNRELVYIVDLAESLHAGKLHVDVMQRDRRQNGSWGVPRFLKISSQQAVQVPDALDRKIMGVLIGAQNADGYSVHYGYYSYNHIPHRYELPGPLFDTLLPLMCESRRAYIKKDEDAELAGPIDWDGGPPWSFILEVEPENKGVFNLNGRLVRDGAIMPLSEPEVLLSDGVLFRGLTACRLEHGGCFQWIAALRKSDPPSIPSAEVRDWLSAVYSQPSILPLCLPESIRPEDVSGEPRPRLLLRKPKSSGSYCFNPNNLVGELYFDYGDATVPPDPWSAAIYDRQANRLIRRNKDQEKSAAQTMLLTGFRRQQFRQEAAAFEIAPKKLPSAVRTLVTEGWRVEAEGKLYRSAGAVSLEVRSGIDWFELDGCIDFAGQKASFPFILAALKKKESVVVLGDGTFGVIPEDWLKKYGLFAGLGHTEENVIRFTRSQAGLLDALLAAQSDAICDVAFEKARKQLHHFDGIASSDAPEGFVGELRHYQKDGLGWLYFLNDFGLGGCLADDMGLGKTVQVLALLESRRRLRKGSRTQSDETGGRKRKPFHAGDGITEESPPSSLVVAPRSLIFNWMQEAARFTPKLKALDYTGQDREEYADRFGEYDLILTTYGTLLRDILLLKDFRFDYVILDESQAVKNANSGSAKAARLLSADHRLALSGTPIENHLGELWSLFEFLNPGMLGSASAFRAEGLGGRNPAPEIRVLLARALRPTILRRTKKQVARELPDKIEQTIYCELDREQRSIYNELRDYYRDSLLRRIETEGIQKAKFFVLEALLRLRQAACHPGLIDPKHLKAAGAKLETLLPQIDEVMEEGHKALVFSQFTSFLAIVRARLDRDKIPYLYLDGKTKDRGDLVNRFQNDSESKLFLISLKAGGLGLNLTAAEYVYLLDPWWNPAVETQAIDRAHRIGQTRQVFAYRLIAKDTVEEKVIELQKEKRLLADAILEQDEGVLRSLKREDLELLLS